MNGRERIEAALELGVPDQVPVMSGLDALVARAAGLTIREFYSSARAYANASMSVWKRFGFDDVFVWWPHAIPEAMGARLTHSDNEYPTIDSPIVKTMADVDALQIPDPRSDGNLPLVLEAMKTLNERVGDQVFLFGSTYGPYSDVGNLLGFERLLIETMKGTDIVRNLLKVLIEAKTTFGEAMTEAGCQLIWMSEPMASPPILPVNIYKEMVLQPWIELTRAFKKAGAYTCWHPCARTKGEYAIFEQLLQGNADMVSFSETTDMRIVKQTFAQRKCVAGNLDPVMIGRSTGKRIEKEVARIVDEAAAGGGFVFTPGCSIPLNTPLENIEAMINAVHEYGKYS